MTMRIDPRKAAIAAAVLLPVSTATAFDALSLLDARGRDDADDLATAVASAPTATDEDEGGLMFRRVDRGTYVSGGYLHEFGTDFSGGGSVAVDRGFGGAGIAVQFHPEVKGSVGVAWGGDWYRFTGDSDLSPSPGAAPWSDVHAITALASANWQIDPRWSANLGLRIGTAGETGAKVADSIVYGGNLAVSYSFSRAFTLGAGALVQTQIEDRPLIIPLLVVYWQATDTIVVSNVLAPRRTRPAPASKPHGDRTPRPNSRSAAATKSDASDSTTPATRSAARASVRTSASRSGPGRPGDSTTVSASTSSAASRS